MLRRGSSLSDCADVLAMSSKTVARCLRIPRELAERVAIEFLQF